MKSEFDDRGYSQIWIDKGSTRIRQDRRCEYMISQMDVDASKSILEIGCGTGRNAWMLAKKTGMDVMGADLCAPFIEEAKAKFSLPNLHYKVLDFNHDADVDGLRFDYVVGNGILHHLYHHLDEALVKVRGLLKDGGKIVFLEPNLHNPYVYAIFSSPALRKITRLEPDEMAFTKGFIADKLARAGFKDIKVEYKDFLLPGIPEFLVGPSVVIGDVLERTPLLRTLSQSIFISATK